MVLGHAGALVCLTGTAAVAWLARPSAKEEATKAFKDHRLYFALAYALLVATESFLTSSGPLLFVQLKFSAPAILGMHLLAGFGATLVSFQAGALLDAYGRKQGCLVCCVLLLVTSVLSHVRSFWCMTTGIFLTNVALALADSSAESWLVGEHILQRGLSGSLLSHMFAMMYMIRCFTSVGVGYINALIYSDNDRPIYSGSSVHIGGVHNAMEVAMLTSAAGLFVVASRWNEHRGGHPGQGHWAYLQLGAKTIWGNSRVLLLGCLVALFSAARITLGRHWMPAMHMAFEPWQMLLYFAVFGMATLCGVSFSTLTSSRYGGSFRSAVVMLGGSIAVGASSLLLASATALHDDYRATFFFSVMLFCMANGFFLPVAGLLKGEIVPEEVRATVYVLFESAGVFLASTQSTVLPSTALSHGALWLVLGLGVLVLLSRRSAPESCEKAAEDVESFYQISKAV